MKSILLIGGAGFIGSNIISQFNLMAKDCQIFVLEPSFASLHRLDGLQVRVFRGEIKDFDLVKSIISGNSIDTVIHLVSTLIPGSNFDDYQREFTDIIFPSIKIMEYCSTVGVKFVYFSSGGTIYGNKGGKVVSFSEIEEMAPISYYGWSKQIMENSVLYMHRTHNLDYLIFRPSNPYGKGQNLYGKQGFVAVALGKILAGDCIQVWGDGSSVRDYLHIDDLGKAVVTVLLDDTILNETLNIGSGIGHSINEIINVLRDIVVENVKVEYIAARQVDVSSVVLDTSKLKSLIHFQPIDIREGISRFYNDIRYGEQ